MGPPDYACFRRDPDVVRDSHEGRRLPNLAVRPRLIIAIVAEKDIRRGGGHLLASDLFQTASTAAIISSYVGLFTKARAKTRRTIL